MNAQERSAWRTVVAALLDAPTTGDRVALLQRIAVSRGDYDPATEVLVLRPGFARAVGLFGVGLNERDHGVFVSPVEHGGFDIDKRRRTIAMRAA